MSALTLRLPDDKHHRLKVLARRRGTSLNRLMEEMATLMLAEFDAETRFSSAPSEGAARSNGAWPFSTRQQARTTEALARRA